MNFTTFVDVIFSKQRIEFCWKVSKTFLNIPVNSLVINYIGRNIKLLLVWKANGNSSKYTLTSTCLHLTISNFHKNNTYSRYNYIFPRMKKRKLFFVIYLKENNAITIVVAALRIYGSVL